MKKLILLSLLITSTASAKIADNVDLMVLGKGSKITIPFEIPEQKASWIQIMNGELSSKINLMDPHCGFDAIEKTESLPLIPAGAVFKVKSGQKKCTEWRMGQESCFYTFEVSSEQAPRVGTLFCTIHSGLLTPFTVGDLKNAFCRDGAPAVSIDINLNHLTYQW